MNRFRKLTEQEDEVKHMKVKASKVLLEDLTIAIKKHRNWEVLMIKTILDDRGVKYDFADKLTEASKYGA